MKNSGNHSPKKVLFKSKEGLPKKRCKSPNINIKRKKDINSKHSHEKQNIFSPSIKSGKTSKLNEKQSNYLINLTNNIYIDESHLNKKNLLMKSQKSQKLNETPKNKYISKITLDNKHSRRMSAINIKPINHFFNKKKEEKSEFFLNSTYKITHINQKLTKMIDELLHKQNLTNVEKEIIFNYFSKNKERYESPRKKINNEKIMLMSPVKKNFKKKKKKNNSSVKFKDNNEPSEKDKKTDKDNNIIIYDTKFKPKKITCFRSLFCCLKTN